MIQHRFNYYHIIGNYICNNKNPMMKFFNDLPSYCLLVTALKLYYFILDRYNLQIQLSLFAVQRNREKVIGEVFFKPGDNPINECS